MFDTFIYPENKKTIFTPSFIVETDPSVNQDWLKHVSKYVLRSKIKIQDCSQEYQVWQAWGDSSRLLHGHCVPKDAKLFPPGSLIAKENHYSIGCKDPRHSELGIRFLSPMGVTPRLPLSYNQVPWEQYELLRMLLGIPEGHKNFIMGQSLPLESNLDYLSGVDFRKGCYLGQELTIRTYHTGVTRKRIVPLYFFSDSKDSLAKNDLEFNDSSLPKEQMDIYAGSKKAGKFYQGIHNIGLGLIRLEYLSTPDKPIDLKCGDLNLRAFAPEWWPRPIPE